MEAKFARTKINLYVRSKPNKSASGVLAPAGTTLKYVEIVKGELVEEIDDWCKDEKSGYFWAGGVENIGSDEMKFIWPLEKSYKRITTPFSETWIMNSKKKHTGIDIAVPVGEKVVAVAGGVVEKIGYLDSEKKMAQYVGVRHDLGDYCTAYLHIESVVQVGKKLNAGDIVGRIAQLIQMGAHLHFNVWRGVYNNPVTHRGALPSIENAGLIDPKADPAFPSNFIDPLSISYN
ncbi:MAG: M23 family metallopeptidase [Candidatus Niyogibacteria bacterium]|nr:M23 family metallopeptidase [Candidatus Niyogibacteria bacterium]